MSDKPFPCTIEGCTMTFTNEDHLNVHRKRHDMVLDLSVMKNNAFADQTPTPTRFIRNCEEVGLFQDLLNVNPFDETFRKALESKPETLQTIDTNSEDTLHTPHILPHISINITPNKSAISNESNYDDVLIIDDSPVICFPKTEQVSSSKDLVITKLKDKMIKARMKAQPEPVVTNDSIIKKPKLITEMKASNKISIYDKDTPEGFKRREMNRMAQMRSRRKKKLQNQIYEEQMSTLKMENNKLQIENSRLKAEVGKLQLLLLKYDSCTCKLDGAECKSKESALPITAHTIQIVQLPSIIQDSEKGLRIAPKPTI